VEVEVGGSILGLRKDKGGFRERVRPNLSRYVAIQLKSHWDREAVTSTYP
jgi:hypothetical protein